MRTRARTLIWIAATSLCVLAIGSSASAATPFEITEFKVPLADANGAPVTQAGSHPQTHSTEFAITTEENGITPSGSLRDIVVDLPPGMVGNPTAMPECPKEELRREACPVSTQVGFVELVGYSVFPGEPSGYYPLFNLEPAPDLPAQLGFNPGNPVYLNAHVRSESDYGVTIEVRNSNETLGLRYTRTVVWGVPADWRNDVDRNIGTTACAATEDPSCTNPAGVPVRSFMTLPTSCTPADRGMRTDLDLESWMGDRDSAVYENEVGGVPAPTSGCEQVPFDPSIGFAPTSAEADSPTGIEVKVRIPQDDMPEGVQQSHVKRVALTLPEGMAVNPASIDGLGTCSPAQVGLDRRGPASCPESSKLGSVEIKTPLLKEPLTGSVYLASQGDNPFGSLLAMYVVAEGPGVVIKLPGEVRTDSVSGRVQAIFDNTPQLPFTELTTRFKEGPRAALVNPPSCGTKTVRAELTPWARPDAPVVVEDTFTVGGGPGGSCPTGSFGPHLRAASLSAQAGDHSPFALGVTRPDGTQRLRELSVALPEGLLGKLAGIPYCPEAALAAIPAGLGTGVAQIAAPACPASQVGTVTVGAGAGPNPFYVQTGKAYLAGPYKGAPLSLAVITPAVAGPFDLGNVVVRVALDVEPTTARVTARSDALPLILHGIPLNLRDVRVDVDRPGFMLNPTGCDRRASEASFVSELGVSAAASAPFQAVNCGDLGFKPKLGLRLSGPTKRAAHPKLRAVLRMPRGGANVDYAQVTLPKQQFLEQSHIRTICTRVQYAADSCPKAAIYGYAKAWSPLLDQPLEGPVYLRSSSNPLPDLVADLNGQIEIDLVGRIDTVKARMRTTFATVPDAPVSKFVLNMQGGKKGLLVNSRNLCAAKPRATAKFDGQNGKVHDFNPRVKTDCGTGKKPAK